MRENPKGRRNCPGTKRGSASYICRDVPFLVRPKRIFICSFYAVYWQMRERQADLMSYVELIWKYTYGQGISYRYDHRSFLYKADISNHNMRWHVITHCLCRARRRE